MGRGIQPGCRLAPMRPHFFSARPKGPPAAPRAVGRGGVRERAQFSHWGPRHACVVGRAGAAK